MYNAYILMVDNKHYQHIFKQVVTGCITFEKTICSVFISWPFKLCDRVKKELFRKFPLTQTSSRYKKVQFAIT